MIYIQEHTAPALLSGFAAVGQKMPVIGAVSFCEYKCEVAATAC